MTNKLNPRDKVLEEWRENIKNFIRYLPKWLQISIIIILAIFIYENSIDFNKQCWRPSLVEWITGWDGFTCSKRTELEEFD